MGSLPIGGYEEKDLISFFEVNVQKPFLGAQPTGLHKVVSPGNCPYYEITVSLWEKGQEIMPSDTMWWFDGVSDYTVYLKVESKGDYTLANAAYSLATVNGEPVNFIYGSPSINDFPVTQIKYNFFSVNYGGGRHQRITL